MDHQIIDRFKGYAAEEESGVIPADGIREIIYEGFSIYSKNSDEILRRLGSRKDHIKVLSDPLSEVTRKERKLLLSLSLLVLLIIQVGLFPTRIAAFGIDFEAENIAILFKILGMVIIYLLLVFIVYCNSDIRKWSLESIQAGKMNFDDKPLAIKDIESIQEVVNAFIKLERLNDHVRWQIAKDKQYNYFSVTRIVIELIIPVVFALIVLFQVFTFDTGKLSSLKSDRISGGSSLSIDCSKIEINRH